MRKPRGGVSPSSYDCCVARGAPRLPSHLMLSQYNLKAIRGWCRVLFMGFSCKDIKRMSQPSKLDVFSKSSVSIILQSSFACPKWMNQLSCPPEIRQLHKNMEEITIQCDDFLLLWTVVPSKKDAVQCVIFSWSLPWNHEYFWPFFSEGHLILIAFIPVLARIFYFCCIARGRLLSVSLATRL